MIAVHLNLVHAKGGLVVPPRRQVRDRTPSQVTYYHILADNLFKPHRNAFQIRGTENKFRITF